MTPMRTPSLLFLLLLAGPAALPAQTPSPAATPAAALTPLTEAVPEETETLITCELTRAPTVFEAPVFESLKEADSAKGVYHYKLWLPKGYAASGPAKRFPCMFIMSAGGNAGMGGMAAHLQARGYVVVLLVESKNGAWGPVVGNFLAAHDDVVKRVRIEEGRKFATGESGGARGSSVFVQARPGFGGVILQAAGAAAGKDGRYLVAGMQRNPRLYVAMTMGKEDGNKDEVGRMKAALNPPSRFQAYDFAGGHDWAPPEVFERAMAWIEGKNGM